MLFAFVPEKLETSLTCLFDTLPWPYKKLIVEDQVAGKGLMPPKARAKGGAATSAPPKQFISDNPKSKGSKGWSKRRQRAGPAPTAEEAAQSAAKEAAAAVAKAKLVASKSVRQKLWNNAKVRTDGAQPAVPHFQGGNSAAAAAAAEGEGEDPPPRARKDGRGRRKRSRPKKSGGSGGAGEHAAAGSSMVTSSSSFNDDSANIAPSFPSGPKKRFGEGASGRRADGGVDLELLSADADLAEWFTLAGAEEAIVADVQVAASLAGGEGGPAGQQQPAVDALGRPILSESKLRRMRKKHNQMLKAAAAAKAAGYVEEEEEQGEEGSSDSEEADEEADALERQRILSTLDAQRLLREEAEGLLAGVVSSWGQRPEARTGDARMLAQMMKSGTLSDKIGALSLAVQTSPLHHLTELASLCSLARKKSRRDAFLAMDALRDLFCGALLPEDRRLIPFSERPLARLATLAAAAAAEGPDGEAEGRVVRQRLLLLWLFEDKLRACYGALLDALEATLNDNVLHSRKAALTMAHALLAARPEGETRLLPMIVNKLGDPERKVAGESATKLLKLCESHPAMRGTVVHEVQRLLRRDNVAVRAVYYAVTFLNQLRLNRGGGAAEAELAERLIDIYFTEFERVFNNTATPEEQAARAMRNKMRKRREQQRRGGGGKGGGKGNAKKGGKGGSYGVARKKAGNASVAPPKSQRAKDDEAARAAEQRAQKLLGALLTGVNRAFPYTRESVFESVRARTEVLFRLRHSADFGTGVQALMLLLQLVAARQWHKCGGSGSGSGGQARARARAAAGAGGGVGEEEDGAMSSGDSEEDDTGDSVGTRFANRFYRTLYAQLQHPDLMRTTSKHALLLNVVFRALKCDFPVLDPQTGLPRESAAESAAWSARTLAFAKRLLQVRFACLALPPPPPFSPAAACDYDDTLTNT